MDLRNCDLAKPCPSQHPKHPLKPSLLPASPQERAASLHKAIYISDRHGASTALNTDLNLLENTQAKYTL